MSVTYPRCFEESNVGKKHLLEQWILSHINFTALENGQPICFKDRTAFYQVELPNAQTWSPEFRTRVVEALMDVDVKEDLERAGLINWCPNASTMIPVHVPSDGNCLLHSIATSIWGIRDNTLMLRRLLGLAIEVDNSRRFHSRWRHYRHGQLSQLVDKTLSSDLETMNREWTEISQCLDPQQFQSVAVPHRFLESIHVYTLANVLRRPIIILTDPTMRTFSGMSLQDNDMGGIYLPLEWKWGETCQSPIALGYSHSHFTPLLCVDDGRHQTRASRFLIPLMNRGMQQLPVRFLLEGEGPEVGELLRRYLKITETVMQMEGSVQNILCADVEALPLHNELNIVKDFIHSCYVCFQQETNMLSSQHLQYQASPSSLVIPARYLPSFETALTPTVEAGGRVRREQLQGVGNGEYSFADPTVIGAWGQSQIHIPAPSFTPRYSFMPQTASLNAPQDKKCVVPSCKFYGDPALGMMCSNCFKNYSIKESRQLAPSRNVRAAPSAPVDPNQPQQAEFYMSMMNERCQDGCGFRCSVQTYPYCHECAGKRRRRAAEREQEMRMKASEASPSGSNLQASRAVDPAQSSPKGQPLNILSTSSVSSASQSQQTPVAGTHAQGVTGLLLPQASREQRQAVGISEGEKGAECMSPTRVLAASSQSVPLTPPEDKNDELLFGSGEISKPSPAVSGASGSQAIVSPGQVTPASQAPTLSLVTTPGTVTSSSWVLSPIVNQLASHVEEWNAQPLFTPSKEQPSPQSGGPYTPSLHHSQVHPLIPSMSREQPSPQVEFFTPSLHQVQPQPTASSSPGHDPLSSSSNMPVIQPAAGVAGMSEEKQCRTAGCSEKAAYKNLCGKCYIGQGMGCADPRNPTVQKLKLMSLQSTTSSAPPALTAAAAGLAATSPVHEKEKEPNVVLIPQRKSSSLPSPPGQPENNKKFVQTWVRQGGNIQGLETKHTSSQRSQPLGLPENQETLPVDDLVESGRECYSPPTCTGPECTNVVDKEGQLCEQCQAILRHARQRRPPYTAVQESLPPEQPCLTERCPYFGTKENFNYCTSCFEILFKQQLQAEESRHAYQGNQQQTAPLNRTLSSPAQVTSPPPSPHTQLGQLCVKPGCSLFGDPKQANRCGRHYREHLDEFSVTHSAPIARRLDDRRPPQGAPFTQSAPMARQPDHQYRYGAESSGQAYTYTTGRIGANLPPRSAFVPSGSGMFNSSTGGSAGRSSGLIAGVVSSSHDVPLEEFYNRVAGGQSSRCLNPACNNFGNPSNRGLCNSCAQNETEARRWILGDEAIG